MNEEQASTRVEVEDQDELSKAAEIWQRVDEMEVQGKQSTDFLKTTHELIETLNEALDIYARVLEGRAEKYGETAFECGPIAALYGRALLRKAKLENNNLAFGTVTHALREQLNGQLIAPPLAGKIIQIDNAEEDEEIEEENENGNEEEETTEDAMKEAEATLEDAWVILEMARNILTAKLASVASEEEKKSISKLLADVYSDIGDLYNENDAFNEAIAEFEKAIELLNDQHYDEQSELRSKIADTMSFAGFPIEQPIEQYEIAAELLAKYVTVNESKVERGKKMLEELQLRIEELKESVKEEQEAKAKEEEQRKIDESKPVHTLIPKRKRAREEESTTDSEQAAKKPKSE